MALTVSSQTNYDGMRTASMQFVGVGDAGSSETNVAKVIVANLNPVPVQAKVWDVEYDCVGIVVQLLWDATSPVVFQNLQGFGKIEFHAIGGAPNPKAAGFTGNILFSTQPTAPSWSYTVKMRLRKTGVAFAGDVGP